MKNYELAQKLKRNSTQDEQMSSRESGDTLDQFKREYQAKYAVKDFNNPYERMSDNFHFRSSQLVDYTVPEKRSTLKPREIKALYSGEPAKKMSQYYFIVIIINERSALASTHDSPQKVQNTQQRALEENYAGYEQSLFES